MFALLAHDDFDAWLQRSGRGYQVFYNADIPEDVTEKTWRRFHDPAEPMHCAVAEVDGELVRIVHLDLSSQLLDGLRLLLSSGSVHAETLGARGWHALIEHVYAEVSHDTVRVYWLTHETNQQAMVLYDVADRSGFVQYRKILG
ncbi:MAG: hypothetical protein R2856_29210 [Caldilineaceae bacterium]